jgi:hypothetical protein
MEKPAENINFYLAAYRIVGSNLWKSESLVLYVWLLATMVDDELALESVDNLLLYTKPQGIPQNNVFYIQLSGFRANTSGPPRFSGSAVSTDPYGFCNEPLSEPQ